MSGWIKLHRSLKYWRYYDDTNAVRLLIHLLVSVNYEPKKWHEITVEAGQLVCSWDTLSRETGLSKQQVRTSMTKLEKSGEVTRKTTNKWQLISLTKWDELQDVNTQITDKPTHKQHTSNTQITPTKESKENKEVKETKNRERGYKFSPPTIEEVEDYFFEKGLNDYKIEAQKFWHYYEANGWKVGKNKMKKWKSAASGWISRIENFKNQQNGTTKKSDSDKLADWVNS